ncbi:MAG: AAA family ATPase [Arthrobacter sp.]|uniref:AAA family ATPase n=1 Tax=unclassified Arthrobacter TaxID=235627 RepID=UPI003FB8E7F1
MYPFRAVVHGGIVGTSTEAAASKVLFKRPPPRHRFLSSEVTCPDGSYRGPPGASDCAPPEINVEAETSRVPARRSPGSWRSPVQPSTRAGFTSVFQEVHYACVRARILITGMSGAGMSTLLEELAIRGHLTVDTDYDNWELPGSVWDESRMSDLLARHDDLLISGTVENQGRFYDRFDHVVLLNAPVQALIERVANRTNNPYGRTRAQQDEVRRNPRDVEPQLRRGATIELDGRRPVSDLADDIEALRSPRHSVVHSRRARSSCIRGRCRPRDNGGTGTRQCGEAKVDRVPARSNRCFMP